MGTNLFYKLVTPQCILSAQGLALDPHTWVPTCLLGIHLADLRGRRRYLHSLCYFCDFYLLRSQLPRCLVSHSNPPANLSGSSFKIAPSPIRPLLSSAASTVVPRSPLSSDACQDILPAAGLLFRCSRLRILCRTPSVAPHLPQGRSRCSGAGPSSGSPGSSTPQPPASLQGSAQPPEVLPPPVLMAPALTSGDLPVRSPFLRPL